MLTQIMQTMVWYVERVTEFQSKCIHVGSESMLEHISRTRVLLTFAEQRTLNK